MKLEDALAQLARETGRARRRLAWERALQAGFWLASAVMVWAAIALSGLHERLPFLLESVTALGALIGLALLTVRAWRAYTPPSATEARQRLALDSRLEISAFEALGDQPARFDPLGAALWRREQERARARAQTARAGPMRVGFDDFDRFKLRFLAPGVLVLALIAAGAAGPERLARAFLPDPGPLLGDTDMAIEAWATPAPYVRAAPVSLSDRIGETLITPPSIALTVRLTGPTGAPRLVFERPGRDLRARFVRAADGAWEARLHVNEPGRLKIVRFHTRADWRLQPAPDLAPVVAFTAPIAILPQEHAQFAYSARDDYGITALALRVSPIDPLEGLAGAEPVDTPLETPAGEPLEDIRAAELDLAAHPYAGMEVEARVVAFDALGQAGESAPMRVRLPEKIFLQPLARAAIEIRRHVLHERRAYKPAPRQRTRTIPAGDILLGDQRIEIRDFDARAPMERAPVGIRHAARLIDTLTMEPDDGYFRDRAVFLGFKLSRAALRTSEAIGETNGAAEILWLTALRAEYGGAADARRALEEAQAALAEALRTGAPREQIAQLMEKLREATNRYLQALMQEAMREGRQNTVEDTEDQVQLSERDLERLMDQVQRLSEQGRTAEAQQLLEQLSQLLNNLDVQLGEAQSSEGGESEGGEGQSEQQLEQSLQELSEAMGEQRELRDDTQQQQQQGQQSQDGGGEGGAQQGGAGGGGELAERQSAVRDQVGEAQSLADQAGAAQSEALEGATQSMREAENALRRGDLEGARAAQDAALDQLREGAEGLASELRERGQDGQAGQQSGPADPLGRQLSGGNDGGEEVEVPTQIDPARAREIMNEIRRRAEDQNRPQAERDYLRRLLDRFSGS